MSANRKLLRSVIKARVGLRPRGKREKLSPMQKTWQAKKRVVLDQQKTKRDLANVSHDISGAQDLLVGDK